MRTDIKIDRNLYNEQNLYLLNIKELRDIGRKVGVPAPATLKKDALIKYILQIVYGEIEPPLRNSYGRPNVREVDVNKYMEKILRKADVHDVVLGASFDDMANVFKVASPDESSLTNKVEQKIFVEDEGKRYLREFAFVASENDVEISKDLQNKYGFENFDVVEIISSGKSIKVVSVNGKIINDSQKLNEDNFGKKQVFHYNTKEKINEEMSKQIEKALEKNAKVVVYSEGDYSGKDVNFVKPDKTQPAEKSYKHFMSLVNLCEKFVYDGENIVVITDQSEFVESVFESFDKEVTSRIKKHLQSRIDEYLGLGNALLVYKLDEEVTYQ